MELLQLKYFSALAHNGNLTNTAKQLYISPPSLSLTISKLESELGVKLFDRNGRHLELNETGKNFLFDIDSMLMLLDSAVSKASNTQKTNERTLRIAVTSTIAWMDVYAKFIQTYPSIILKQEILYLDDLNYATVSKYDLLMTCPDDVRDFCDELEYEYIYTNDHPVLFIYPEHPLANRQFISMKEIAGEPFIALSKHFSSRKWSDKLCELAGITPRIVAECDFPLRERMISSRMGVSIVNAHAKRNTDLTGIKAIDIVDPKYTRAMAVYWPRKKPLKQAARLFKDYVVNYYKDIDLSI